MVLFPKVDWKTEFPAISPLLLNQLPVWETGVCRAFKNIPLIKFIVGAGSGNPEPSLSVPGVSCCEASCDALLFGAARVYKALQRVLTFVLHVFFFFPLSEFDLIQLY